MAKRNIGKRLTTWEVLNIEEALKERAARWEANGVGQIAITQLRDLADNLAKANSVRLYQEN